MDNIMKYVFEYRYELIYLVILIIGIAMNPSEFKARLYQAMLEAKKLSKQNVLKTGLQQEDWVVENLSKFVGKRFNGVVLIMGDTNLRMYIRKLYNAGFDLLDDGKLNNSMK